MEKLGQPAQRTQIVSRRPVHQNVILLAFVSLAAFFAYQTTVVPFSPLRRPCSPRPRSVYGSFPKPDDPFHFLPCTDTTLPPALEDRNADQTWAALFDPNPAHWSWGNASLGEEGFDGRGIYLCGFLDVPLDYTNASDVRIVRLAVTKYQVSGLARQGFGSESRYAGRKSERTIILNPGGPGGSGTSYLWRSAEQQSKRFSDGKFDVLGWDPRGVNASQPAIACFPHDADRDRYSLLSNQYRGISTSPLAQLRVVDAMNNATFSACKEVHGDLPRFVGTAFVAHDLERIRIALEESELTAYLVSYGTGIGQTYANMFPTSVGRMILDGTEYVRDHRLLGGFGWTALDNGTDAWHDGFLGECLAAGSDHCALASSLDGHDTNVTLHDLQARMSKLLESLIYAPLPAYTESSGPSLITFSVLVEAIYGAMYNPFSWPALAKALSDLEQHNTSLVAQMLDRMEWEFDPSLPCSAQKRKPSSDELGALVICADSYDAPQPPFDSEDSDGLAWWSSLWSNMTTQSWVAGDSRFFNVFSCRHYRPNFGSAVGVYRGDLNKTLAHPVLLIAETYDPATPLRNGRRLLAEMGPNARLIVHHGYGHSSRDTSKCTEDLARDYILHGRYPSDVETNCFADEKPYRYGVSGSSVATLYTNSPAHWLQLWQEHLQELQFLSPWVGSI